MISAETRRTVRTLYAFACGYCGVQETEVGAYLTIDHYQTQEAGGSDEISNLVYACHACNLHKSTAWNALQPPVLHPLRTEMSLHICALPDGNLQGLTPEGVRYIETLHLNWPPMVERRKNYALSRCWWNCRHSVWNWKIGWSGTFGAKVEQSAKEAHDSNSRTAGAIRARSSRFRIFPPPLFLNPAAWRCSLA